MCGLTIPETVQGESYLPVLNEKEHKIGEGVLIACYHPFGQFSRKNFNGKEYRGIRTIRYTYVEDLEGPWLLYDNETDPFQMENLVNLPEYSGLQKNLKKKLEGLLNKADDKFLPSAEYLSFWGYEVNEEGVFPYQP